MTIRRTRARHARRCFKVWAAIAVVVVLAAIEATLALSTSSNPAPRAAPSGAAPGVNVTVPQAPAAPATTTTVTTAVLPTTAPTSTTTSGSTEPGASTPTASDAEAASTVSLKFHPDVLTARGVYEFSGGNSGADAANADLAGTTLTFEWSQLEPAPGQFAWNRVDNAIAPWAAAGKQVILRVSTGGEATWGAAAANATPAWVYAQGVPSVNDDGSTLPAYWNAKFLADYDAFVRAYAARYDGKPVVSFIEMGIGDGGETLPDTQESTSNRLALWTARGYSDDLWLATVENIATTFRQDFLRTPVVPLVDSTFLGPSRWNDYMKLTGWFVANGFPMQYDGITAASTPQDSDWVKTTIVAEQRGPAARSGDTLAGECADATGPMKSRVILVYQSDITDPANRGSLATCAAKAAS
jgi:Beta-galactosidase